MSSITPEKAKEIAYKAFEVTMPDPWEGIDKVEVFFTLNDAEIKKAFRLHWHRTELNFHHWRNRIYEKLATNPLLHYAKVGYFKSRKLEKEFTLKPASDAIGVTTKKGAVKIFQ